MFLKWIKNSVLKEGKRLFVLMTMILGALLLLGGCGGGGDGEQKMPVEIQGHVHTFLDNAGGGRVECYTTDGTLIPGTSGTLTDRGYFSVTSEALPERFLVVVDEIIESKVKATSELVPVPPLLSVLVERSKATTSMVAVTPLTSLVATYALATEKSAEEADQDMAHFLGLWPSYSPSRLLPGLELWDFSFLTLAAQLKDSKLSLDAFQDSLVKRARAGETHQCRGGGNGASSIIMKWALGKVADSIGEKLADAGVGWLTSLILGGEGPDKYMEKLEEISQKMDKIYSEILLMETDIMNMLQAVLLEADYKALIDAAAIIEVQYEKLASLPKYKDRQDAALIAKEIVSDVNHTNVLVALKKIHHIMGGVLATSTYAHLADQLVGQVAGKKMTPDNAFDEYQRIFLYVGGLQIKGLILATEHHHSFLKNPASVRTAVTDQLKSHTDAIRDQVEPFLNGVEKLCALLAGGDSSLVYYNGQPLGGTHDSKYYPRFDSLAGDALGANSQVVFRLTWDARVATQYAGLSAIPSDYRSLFTFMQGRMNLLATNGAGVTLRQSAGGAVFSPVLGRGSLNRIVNRFSDEAETETMVRRYMFRDLSSSSSSLNGQFELIVDEAPFNLKEGEAPQMGTVGERLITNEEGPIHFTLVNNAEKDEDNTPYATIALYAWLPETYLHHREDDRPAGPMDPVLVVMNHAERKLGHFSYGIQSRRTGLFIQMGKDSECNDVAVCDASSSMVDRIQRKFVRYVSEPDKIAQDFLRYRDQFSIYWSVWDVELTSRDGLFTVCPGRNGCPRRNWEERRNFDLDPDPTLISRFRDPRFYAFPRVDATCFIRTCYSGGDVENRRKYLSTSSPEERGEYERFVIRKID